ncbi:LysR family transcriptional regulator [Granulicella mallensis]|uniref:Transcriptional regulator, LysR family n=1 Tax=Granulicella mallensis (strain ATCC BAA-1857 / DSM 23137 / MP5ACTX8) TaxID=682795 RepID=G8NUP6_GRAMM|nr:LysR family transcriptional regulator [Granulicella mallensis]AEU37586.1 transcriptional regulator, LysR family [Granulicella mallensis MP5ACTX8]
MYEWAELRHFKYLLTILERQGFRAAAEELRTAQPNLSVQARQFQENASVRLFRKVKGGRIRPTETGVAFKVLARFLLETRDEVVDALIAIERGEVSSVRFGCSPLIDQSLFQSFCDLHKEILPVCPVRPTHGDTAHLAEEVVSGTVDAAIVTLPLRHPDLRIEELRRDRLVACLRRDDPFAAKASLQVADLQGNLAVLYHPQRHPDAHERLLELLGDAGVKIEDYSCASHPSEMQTLVKGGHGFALIREGINLDEELTTRPIAGVDWTVDTAFIYRKTRHPKTVPILVKRLVKQLSQTQIGKETALNKVSIPSQASIPNGMRPAQREKNGPVQMALIS